jgi:alkanesulfonate monooxygenase SsuD/methylene tetrahydromethanopterin reductase-like flavin-dependent oxidoreductase (luciferase family)
MKIGVGLPVGHLESLPEWARRADAGPFSTLGLLDRLVWANPEPLVTLAVLAGATTRIRLQTEVLLVPLRQTALLAKQVATLDRLSGGRFTLGVGIGVRDDDDRAAGVPDRGRGARMDEQMARLRSLWAGEPVGDGIGPVGPVPLRPGGPEVLVGGFAPAALARVARFGDGLLCAAPPAWAAGLFATVTREWVGHGRSGAPRNVGQVNVALGPDAVVAGARTAMADYYAFTGDASRMTAGLRTTRAAVRDTIAAFADLGADEVVLYCWATDPTQLDRLADLTA